MQITLSPISNAQFTEGIRQFLFQCAAPTLPSIDCVLNGYENDVALPKHTNDFCVFTPLSYLSRGKVFEEWHTYEEGLRLCEYVTAEIQVDCFSNSKARARDRAGNYELLAGHSIGVDFFLRYGIDCQYAEAMRNLTQVLDSNKFTARYTLTLRLGFWKKLDVRFEFFDHLNLDGIHIVDVRFPPKEVL